MKDKMLIWISKFSTNKYVTAIKNGVGIGIPGINPPK